MSTQLRSCAEHWSRLSDSAEAAQQLMTDCQRAVQDNEGRRSEALQFFSLFEGVSMTSFDERGYDYDDDEVFRDLDIPVVRNTCRSIVTTALAKITAQDSPLPQFMSNGGDWETRTKAVRLDRLVCAEYRQPQGQFANLHELFRHGANLAMAGVGSFAVFYLAGPDRVIAELDDTLTLGIETGGRFGRIVTLVRTAWYHPEELICRFPEFEDEILASEERMPDGLNDMQDLRPTRGVRVYQGWRVALTSKSFGREMFCLKDGTVLRDNKEYDRPDPPCAIWHYERSQYGKWGVSLTRTIYNQCVRINQILNDVDEAERNSPQNIVMHKKGGINPGDIEKVKGWQFVEHSGSGVLGQDFQVFSPPKYNQDSVVLLQFHEAGAHSISGISEQHTAAKRSVGTTSGKHENMVAALFTERFAEIERRLIDMRTTVSARLIVWALQDMIDEVPDYKRIYAKGDFIEEVKLKDLDLDMERYTITIAAVSEDKDSPRARLDWAQEQADIGNITGAELLSFQQDYDQKAKSQLVLAQENWLERQIDMWLHSDDVEYQGPIQWMDLKSAAKTVAQALLVARTKKAPAQRMQWFTRFLDEVQTYIDRETMQASASLSSSVDPASIFAGAAPPAPPPGAIPGAAGPSPAGPPPGSPL